MNKSAILAVLAAVLVISTSSLAADDDIVITAGSELHVQLITTLSSKDNDNGDFWTAKVVEPIFGNGGEIVPDGSTVDGHITYEKGPEKVKGKGEMRLVADSISTPDSSKYTFAPSSQDAKGANSGTEVSALAPHKKGKYIVVSPGTEITFPISHDTIARKVMPRISVLPQVNDRRAYEQVSIYGKSVGSPRIFDVVVCHGGYNHLARRQRTAPATHHHADLQDQ